jgi:LuxR family transcriptional regulator, maltose regulon positive regulatory protein
MIRALSQERAGCDAGAFVPIVRPRIVDRITAVSTRSVVLLIAPAGYGKSVALRQYLSTLSNAYVRFDVSSEHAKLLGFLRGLAQAVGDAAPHALAALAGAYERNPASPTRGADLALWMDAHLESFHGIVAVDDLHVTDGDPEVARFLASLIERTKGRVRWVLASRSTAGLPIGSWLAYGDADLAVDERDLRFTIDEAREAARTLSLRIRDEELSDLLSLTEGWPAAMSFALRSSTRSADLRNISALTREMIYRFLAEQVYAALDDDERALLEVAIALPIIDVGVLERAGFDRALPMIEALRQRTAFIYAESPGIYRCDDLFGEFLRRQSALAGRSAQQAVCARAARALEESDDVEHAIAAFAGAGYRGDVVRLLEQNGFDLLERARGDIVARAIERLDERTRRENATILALRGALHAIAGRMARAETLLRRSLARARDDGEFVATVSLRLALLVGNQGRDVTDLLNPVANDPVHTPAHRAEALSLIAACQAIAGDTTNASSATSQIERLLPRIRSDVTRAKILHHLGIVSRHAGAVSKAFDVLGQASDLAAELHLYGLASRVNAVLSNLALHEEDDVERQLRYAQQAADAATKAGDSFALQTALLQMLSAEMRRGNVARSAAIEDRLELGRVGEITRRYLALFRSARLAWEGRFGEAQRMMSCCWSLAHFDFDRAMSGGQYALFLALDGRREASVRLVSEVVPLARSLDASGLFGVRSLAIAQIFCALAEATNGRVTHADRIARRVRADGDAVIALTSDIARSITSAVRRRRDEGAEATAERIAALREAGYADVAIMLRAVDRALRDRSRSSLCEGRLTPSEREVLRLLAEGLIPKEIAAETGRSVFTVRVHIANAIAKLGCHGRFEAIEVARREGFLR